MRLGTQTASVQNWMYSRAVKDQPEPFVGMGVTILSWTDRDAGTVMTWDGKILCVTRDDARLVSGSILSEAQEYEYRARPDGAPLYFRRERSGRWQRVIRNEETGRWNKYDVGGLRIGERLAYRDPSF